MIVMILYERAITAVGTKNYIIHRKSSQLMLMNLRQDLTFSPLLLVVVMDKVTKYARKDQRSVNDKQWNLK